MLHTPQHEARSPPATCSTRKNPVFLGSHDVLGPPSTLGIVDVSRAAHGFHLAPEALFHAEPLAVRRPERQVDGTEVVVLLRNHDSRYGRPPQASIDSCNDPLTNLMSRGSNAGNLRARTVAFSRGLESAQTQSSAEVPYARARDTSNRRIPLPIPHPPTLCLSLAHLPPTLCLRLTFTQQ